MKCEILYANKYYSIYKGLRQEDLERCLRLLRYMDDDFMTVCLADNYEGAELILRIVLE